MQNKDSWCPKRSQAYIGVLVDDLITKGVTEPYRMFTSRAEYRLQLREDNADLRLTEIGRELGVVSDYQWDLYCCKKDMIVGEVERLKSIWIQPTGEDSKTAEEICGKQLEREYSLHDLLKRPEISYTDLTRLTKFGNVVLQDESAIIQVEIQIKYAGYVARQEDEVGKQAYLDDIKIPKNVDYSQISGLSAEVIQKLDKFKPETLGQASRISGITPAAISLLLVFHKKGFPLLRMLQH